MNENETPEITCTGSIKLNFPAALMPLAESENEDSIVR
jgi:hypothetical protein